MPRGGARPGAGRKAGTKIDVPLTYRDKVMLEVEHALAGQESMLAFKAALLRIKKILSS